MSRKPQAMVLAMALAVVLAPAAASADSEVEPNDHVFQLAAVKTAYSGPGPLTGTLSDATDQDVFALYSAAPQMDVVFTVTDAGCASVTVRDSDNRAQVAGASSHGPGDAQHLQFATADATTNRYFVTISHDGCDRANYQVDVAGGQISDSIGLNVQPATAESEPDDAPAQATGPFNYLSSYTGTIASATDEDWLYFNTPTGTSNPNQIDIYAAATSACGTIHVQVFQATGSPAVPLVGEFTTGVDQIGHVVSDALPNSERFNVRITGDCAGQGWWLGQTPFFEYAPGLPVWFPVPPDPQRVLACKFARQDLIAARERVLAARRAVRQAATPGQRRIAKRRLSRASRRYRTAQAHRRHACQSS